MCGRYSIKRDLKQCLKDYFPGIEFDPMMEFQPNESICPTLEVPVVLNAHNVPFCTLLKWGLIPHWSREERPGVGIINARCETVAVKPSFKGSFRRKRCVIPADSFYEWKRVSSSKKIPYRFSRRDNAMLLMAGIWDEWERPAGLLRTFAVITTEANEFMAEVHDRMPVILNTDQAGEWLAKNEETEAMSRFFDSRNISPLIKTEAVGSLPQNWEGELKLL